MKIALITYYWKNSDGGGIRTYLVNLAEALKERGAEINVLFRSGNDPEYYQGPKNNYLFAIKSYFYLRKIRPDMIQTHEVAYGLLLLPAVLYKMLHGCTLIYTFHTEPFEGTPLRRPFLVFFQGLLNACDGVTFVSKRLQERVIEVQGLSFSRTAITYAGVQASDISDGEVERFHEQYKIDKSNIVLLAQAMTAHPLKAEGLKLLILALRILQESYPNILLIVTREGQYFEDVKAFAREVGVEKHVVFTGDVENPFVPLKLCDLYTHITLGDGLPLALLEAMAMGKPIVATPIGGIPEAITDGKNGLLVAPDPKQVADKIDILLQNREYAESLGRCAKKTVEEEFSWERAAKKFIDVYEDFR